ncbi:MAG: hypothetical protein ABF932_14645 [Gluconobacter potus]|uniref:hypothetical protein n=1 Tax=Gluconobacter potus TaxID=2724927 RepID=UPI0039EB2B4D
MSDKIEFSLHQSSVSAAGASYDASMLPAWHVRRPHFLKSALAVIQKALPTASDIAGRYLPRMPCRVRASMTEDETATQIMDLVDAVSQDYVSPNTPDARNALLFRLGSDWKEPLAALPAMIRPMIVTDAEEQRGFAILWLSTPVITSVNGRLAPQILADWAEKLMAHFLGASRLPALALVGSPWAIRGSRQGSPTSERPVWKIRPGAERVELRAVVKLLSPRTGPDFGENCDSTSDFYNTPKAIRITNQYLFNNVRRHFAPHPSPDSEGILAYARAINRQFPRPVPPGNVMGMCQRIHDYLHKKLARRATRRRDPDETSGQAQARSARETGEMRFAATSRRLVALVVGWPVGKKLTQSALAVAAGVSDRTVYDHGKRPIATGSSLPLSGSISEINNFARLECCFPGKTLSDLIAHRKIELEDLAYFEKYKHDLRRSRNPANPPNTPVSGWDNPEIAFAYRDAEIAFEDVMARKRRSVLKAARERQLRQAGLRGDISAKRRALIAVPTRLALLQPYLEKKYPPQRLSVLVKIIRRNMENKIKADFRVGAMARLLHKASPSPIAPARFRAVRRQKTCDPHRHAIFRILRRPASGLTALGYNLSTKRGRKNFCDKLVNHLVQAGSFNPSNTELLKKQLMEALRIYGIQPMPRSRLSEPT